MPLRGHPTSCQYADRLLSLCILLLVMTLRGIPPAVSTLTGSSLLLWQKLLVGYTNTAPHTGRLSEPRLALSAAAAGPHMLFAGESLYPLRPKEPV
jgi:hypothetical protein